MLVVVVAMCVSERASEKVCVRVLAGAVRADNVCALASSCKPPDFARRALHIHAIASHSCNALPTLNAPKLTTQP